MQEKFWRWKCWGSYFISVYSTYRHTHLHTYLARLHPGYDIGYTRARVIALYHYELHHLKLNLPNSPVKWIFQKGETTEKTFLLTNLNCFRRILWDNFDVLEHLSFREEEMQWFLLLIVFDPNRIRCSFGNDTNVSLC